MNRIRLAVFGSSPCHACTAACCKQNGHDYAVLLRGDELRRFAPWAVDVPIRSRAGIVSERVLPYVGGRCAFLGDDDLCQIYEDRPLSCREFQCTHSFASDGPGRHGRFLQLNPAVAALLEAL